MMCNIVYKARAALVEFCSGSGAAVGATKPCFHLSGSFSKKGQVTCGHKAWHSLAGTWHGHTPEHFTRTVFAVKPFPCNSFLLDIFHVSFTKNIIVFKYLMKRNF